MYKEGLVLRSEWLCEEVGEVCFELSIEIKGEFYVVVGLEMQEIVELGNDIIRFVFLKIIFGRGVEGIKWEQQQIEEIGEIIIVIFMCDVSYGIRMVGDVYRFERFRSKLFQDLVINWMRMGVRGGNEREEEREIKGSFLIFGLSSLVFVVFYNEIEWWRSFWRGR